MSIVFVLFFNKILRKLKLRTLVCDNENNMTHTQQLYGKNNQVQLNRCKTF